MKMAARQIEFGTVLMAIWFAISSAICVATDLPTATITCHSGLENCDRPAHYALAKRLLNAAERAIAERRYRTAIVMLDKALVLIGDDYAHNQLIDDDTGMKAALAKAEARRGHLRIAAGLKRNVVGSRLEIWAKGRAKNHRLW